jgi:hypothetical protein
MRKEPVGLMEIGLRILLTETDSDVFPGKKAFSTLVTNITVVEEAVQDALLFTEPPKVELTVAVHVPVVIDTSEGNVILIPAPTDKGFLTTTVKVYVVVADTIEDRGLIDADIKKFGLIVIVAVALA